MPYETTQIIVICYSQIGAHKSANIATFALSDFVLLLVCHIEMLVLNKCKKKTLLLQFVSGLGESRYFDWIIKAVNNYATTLPQLR